MWPPHAITGFAAVALNVSVIDVLFVALVLGFGSLWV
jgi:hypothetical protein